MGVGDCPALSANLGRNYRAYNQERPGNTGSNTDRQNHSGISRPDSGRQIVETRGTATFRGNLFTTRVGSAEARVENRRTAKFRAEDPAIRIYARICWSLPVIF